MFENLKNKFESFKSNFEEKFSLEISDEEKNKNLKETFLEKEKKLKKEIKATEKKLADKISEKEDDFSKKLEDKNIELEKEKKRKPMRIGLSFGFFSFLLSPIILFQSILLFLFLISLSGQNQANDIIKVFSQNSFLALELKLLFYSILLLLLFNLVIGLLGLIFDRQKLFAIMSLVISTLALILIFLAPKLLSFQSNVLGNFF